MKAIEPTDMDRRIWDEELDCFVPKRVFDIHTHAYLWSHNLTPGKDGGPDWGFVGRDYPESDWDALELCDRLLMPGREVHRLIFPFPFAPACDFDGANRFVSRQSARDASSGSLMLVNPAMTKEYIEEQLDRHGFLGFKPYRFYSVTGDPVESRITDFLPRHQIEIAHRRGLLIMMHVSKRNAIADPQNIEDLTSLAAELPGAQWILAHCARSYSTWAIDKAAPHLRGLPNIWFDTSSVCESDAFDALFSGVGVERVMYGSDDIPVGVMRGKYITFGFAWTFLSEENHRFSLAHADPRMTFTRYEQLRAMRRAARRLSLTPGQVDGLFHGTAEALVRSARDRQNTGNRTLPS